MTTVASSKDKGPSSEEERAPWFSRLFLLYLNPLFDKGAKATSAKNQIELVDLGVTSKQDQSLRLYTEFTKQWQHERRLPHKQRSLWFVLWRTVGYSKLFKAIGLYLGYSASSFGPVMILNALVKHFEGTSELSPALLWILVSLIFVIPMVGSVLAAQSNVVLAHAGVQFRNAMVDVIYRKSLRLSPAARQKSSTGQIVNMFSNDTAQLQRFLFFLNNMVVALPTIIVCLYLIYLQVGVATFVGLGLIVIAVPLNAFIFSMLGAVRRTKVGQTDRRVKLMNEILNGIRIIKFYSWELAFKDRVEKVRLVELKLLRKIAYIIAVGFSVVLIAVPTFLPVLIFFTYVKLGNQLDAAKAFTAIALFNLLQFPFIFLPLGLTQYNQSRVSTGRMLTFLELEELAPYVDKTMGEDDVVISMDNVCMGWIEKDSTISDSSGGDSGEDAGVGSGGGIDGGEKSGGKVVSKGSGGVSGDSGDSSKVDSTDNKDSVSKKGEYEMVPTDEKSVKTTTSSKKEHKYDAELNRSIHTLNSVSFSVKKGELVAVVGAVGSGKSSLLNGLLGEMLLQTGTVRVHGSVAFCDQRPWILNDTVQGNVLFGHAYDEARFDAALYASSLEDDVTILPGGVNTQIGERGINLSGGQKARVALARAIYTNADIYLLDDPLSAVDAHVGQFLFHEGIRNGLAGKTRVLVTHQIHLLPYFDKIIVMEAGQVKAFGHYEELKKSGIDIEAYIPSSATTAAEGTVPGTAEGEEGRTSAHSVHSVHSVRGGSVGGSVGGTPGSAGVVNRKRMEVTSTTNTTHHTTTTHTSATTGDTSHIIPPTPPTPHAIPTVVTVGKEVPVPVPAAVGGNIGMSAQNLMQEVGKEDPSANTPTRRAMDDANSESSFASHREKAQAQALLRRSDARATTLNSTEERSQGEVTSEIYLYYIKSGGWCLFFTLCMYVVANQAATILGSYWLSHWGDVSVRHEDNNDPLTVEQNVYFLNIYAILSCCILFFYMMRSIALADHRMHCSVHLHIGLLKATLFAPVSFFDVTPIGRILNRFSSDLQTVDEEISQNVSQGLNSIASVISAVGAIAGATRGTFLILLVPMSVFYHVIQKYFKATNTSIARLESISRSPIYADFSQALSGLTSIRAYNDSARFIAKLESLVDHNTVANVTQQLASQWLAIRLDLIGALISFFVAVVAAAAPGFIPPGFLALALVYSFQLTTYLKFLVRVMATLEAQLNSVERIKYYMDHIEVEGAPLAHKTLEVEQIPPEWPSQGVVTGTDIEMKYRDGPLVLKGLSFDIQGGEKVGVAGRTGSGKSSLMIGLFRIQELHSGSISIDNIDISTVPLHHLRSKLGIIPQDPVMFSASVRFNLDPFEQHSDAEIWEVLESINMRDHVLSLPNKLQEEVAEGGDNFSAGQRQLICIARAILRKPKILVLDEATASIDNETDALVQRMVREQFKQCTVLTIAHRLNTIIDSDKIMVMDDGRLAEFDAPQTLLAVPSGMFKSLWDKHIQSHGADH